MAVFKCKMCGTEIDTEKHGTNNKCEICGAMYAFRPVEQRIADWYDEADTLRRDCEFEKAESLYRNIISTDKTQADAYWGAVLCKYCVGCVNDRYMFSRVSICRGTSADSIKSDEDFKLALEYGDKGQKSVYNSEVEEIIRTQKEIFNTMSAEEPFDIFISYKEKDSNGKRTDDSDTAEALYKQFSKDGFKVFYAPVTLNGVNKKGRKYLTNIFAAVNSAKVMFVVGSKPEYFTAEWVKSEWSRFLALTKIDSSKIIIPCFSDMTEGDLPKALEQFQAQNITKTTGIFNVVNTVIEYLRPQQSSSSDPAANIKKRAFKFLEKGEWDKAFERFEKVLDEYNTEDAECYLGELMYDLKVKKRKDLGKCSQPFDDNPYYEDACRYDEKIAAELNGYISEINNRIEEEKNSKKYTDAVNKLNAATTEAECLAAAEIFESIKPYSDSAEKIAECREKANEITYTKALNKLNAATTEAECSDAADIFESILSYSDSAKKIKECEEKGKALTEKKYADTLLDFKAAKTEAEYKKAGEQFDSVSGYKDSAVLSEKSFALAEDVKQAAENAERLDVIRRALEVEVKEKSKKVLKIMFPTYTSLNQKQYSEAVNLLTELSGYNNLENYLNEIGISLPEIRAGLPANTISVGFYHTVGLKTNGTVVAVGGNSSSQCNVSKWKDIVAVSAGGSHTVGLKTNGTVVVVGNNVYNQCNVSDWKDIVAVSAGKNNTIGLKSDGTVVAVGYNVFGQCDVSKWKDIVAISAGDNHTVGLKSDGTVVAVGYKCNVSKWNDIVAVSARDNHTVGLKSDGTVVAVGKNDNGQCNVSDWKDIVAVSAGWGYIVGLKSDGTVVAVGNNDYGQCDVSDWKDIVAISAGETHTIGLKSDGTFVTIGKNYLGQCDVSDWKDIKTTN